MSSLNRTDKISVAIPIMFAALMIGSLIGIIGNSLLINTSVSGFDNNFASPNNSREFRIFKIVLSSILTLIFLLLTIFASVEILEPEGYKAKILTQRLDSWLESTYNNLESWELILILSNYILLPVGLATSLMDGGGSYFIFSAIAILIVFFSYNQRVGTRNAIRATLPAHQKISLADLSKMISKDPKYVRKALVHLVSFEDFPATYDFAAGMITYNAEINVKPKMSGRVLESEVVVSNSTRLLDESSGVNSRPCPYCGESPAVPHAAFCGECGASLIAAK